MSAPSVEFHKIWIGQCEAAQTIQERFGVNRALDYLIGEKLFAFVEASEQDADFGAELPAFVAQIRSMFHPDDIQQYLDRLQREKFMAPPEPEEDDLGEEEIWPASPVRGAEELLRFARIRQLLRVDANTV